LLPAAVLAPLVVACYSAGDGTAPPPNSLYFPVGLDVSTGGDVLYVANSDFDLQFNGGTIQSYDLHSIRQDVVTVIDDPTKLDPSKLLRPSKGGGYDADGNPCTNGDPPVYRTDGSGLRQPLGETCAPPVNSTVYVKDSVTIGAFATDLQVLRCTDNNGATDKSLPPGTAPETTCAAEGTKLFVPVRGDASVTWAALLPDSEASPAYTLACNDATASGARRCDDGHHAGNNPDEAGNTRHITMPGEPFGMAQSDDAQSLVITHQTDTKVSLLSTGVNVVAASNPSLQFVLDGLPTGGVGIVSVPHDPAACADGSCMLPRPAFLLTSRAKPEMHLLRYYSDDGSGGTQPQPPSTLFRPFLNDEGPIAITANAVGTDSRGIAIDRTPRLACKAKVRATTPATDPTFVSKMQACARTPARVFIANRTPPSLLIGEVGGLGADGSYDPDKVTLFGNLPLSNGPSKLYLAPVVEQDPVDGKPRYALRLFIICFDSATLFVYDPDTGMMENVIRTAPGPFAMAFDPFTMEDVAQRAVVPSDDIFEPVSNGTTPIHKYRFAYLASFTESYVQVLDLDNSRPDKSTFEVPVFTLGGPTLPKGTQ
jgi:hypothetical protein